MNTKSFTLFCIFILSLLMNCEAKVWRINNTPGVDKDFVNGGDAIASSSVLNGDTLHFEGSPTSYAGFGLTKRLVLIGNGYFLSGTDGNLGLQANTNPSSFGNQYIVFDSTGSGSELIGLSNFFMAIGGNLGSATDNITITRCNFNGIGTYYGYAANTDMTGWKINKCYITGTLSSSALVMKNWDVRNNLMNGIEFQNTANVDNIFRNNVIRYSINIYGGYFANNIISAYSFGTVNTVVKNNLAIGTPPGFAAFIGSFNNSQGYTDAQMFQGLTGNSLDGQWRLKAGAPAIAAGLTVGSVVSPDCGAFGATDPYRLSGIPNIPTIYTLTVPATIPTGASSMNITFSTRSNN
ncbi:MAG: hypothetical protein QM687_09740 [Ferruginibacter sp.]